MNQHECAKKKLRQQAMAYRQMLTPAVQAQYEADIQAHLLTVLQSHGPCTVGVFSPCKSEPNILPLMQHVCLQAWRWALPICMHESHEKRHLQFAAFAHGDTLVPGAYGIAVPLVQHWVQPQVVLVPCVAFHASGARLGYGAGWYDKTLPHLPKAVYLGIAYAATQTQEHFAMPHDVLLHGVVTENGFVQAPKA